MANNKIIKDFSKRLRLIAEIDRSLKPKKKKTLKTLDVLRYGYTGEAVRVATKGTSRFDIDEETDGSEKHD